MAKKRMSAPAVALNARIEAACSELKLPTVARLYESLCDEAVRKQQGILDVLVELLEAEVEGRLARRDSALLV
jgi:DNA replication protein DnaC